MSLLVISSSLNPSSLSRIMARQAYERLAGGAAVVEWIDLRDHALPFCDGDACYGAESVRTLTERIRDAHGVLLATPVYNYSAGASVKNLIELTGDVWRDKVVGFLCAAGGPSSYMAIMGLANSLMLDFRCVIVPRFVYASEEAFAEGALRDDAIGARIDELARALERITLALHPAAGVPGGAG